MKCASVHFILSACILLLPIGFSSAHTKDPLLGDTFEVASKDDRQEERPSPGTGTLSIQSATIASQGPSCDNDAECQALCPSSSFTTAQPPLTSPAVEQQLEQCANAMRTSPNSFASLINGVCNYADFQADVTNPQRPPFAINSALSVVAEAHCNDMADTNFFNHYSQNGSSPYDRIKAVLPSVTIVSELIAAGWTDVRSLMLQFMCSEKHRNLLMSCSYDTLGFGVAFSGSVEGLPASAQWPSYFTADLACSSGSSCTCTSTPQAIPSSVGQPALGTTYSSSQPQVSFTATFTSLLASSLQPNQVAAVAADVIAAIQALAAPVPVNVSSSQIGAPNASPPAGRRRLQQTSATEQTTVSFNLAFPSQPASASASALQADVSAALTQYMESIPVQITYTPTYTSSGIAFNVSVQLPPNDQLSSQESYSTEFALALAHDLENNPNVLFSSVISKDGPVTVSSTETQDQIVQAVAASPEPPAVPLPTLIPSSPGSAAAPAQSPGAAAPAQSPGSPGAAAAPSAGQSPPGQRPGSPAAGSPPAGPSPAPQGPPAAPLVASSGSSVQVAAPYVPGSSNPPTMQSTVNVTITLTSVPSSTQPDPSLANIISSDITAFVGGPQPLVTITPDASGPNLALNLTAVYPTNSQFTNSINTGTQQASILADGIRSAPTNVFVGLIAKEGAISVSNLQTITQVVQSGESSIASAPLVSQTPPASAGPAAAAAPSEGIPSPVPTPTSTAQPAAAPSPVSTQSPSPSSVSTQSRSPSPVSAQSPPLAGPSPGSTQPPAVAASPPAAGGSPSTSATSSPSVASGPASSTGPTLVPTVVFTLTFSNLAASSVTNPTAVETEIAKDIEAFVTAAQLAKLTELPVAAGQNWAANVTVILQPDNQTEVSQATARAEALALALQTSPDKVFATTTAKSGPVTATDIETLVRVVTGGTAPGSAEAAAAPAGSATYIGTPSGSAASPVGAASPGSSPASVPVSASPASQSPTASSPSPPPAGPAPTPVPAPAPAMEATLQTVTFTLVLTDIAAGGHASAVEGYISADMQNFVAAAVSPVPPIATSYVEDHAGQNLAVNVSVAFPGSAAQTSQTFADAQTAAQALATAINTDPGSVFKTLIAKNVHGKAENVAILGPSAAAPAGSPAAPAAAPGQATPQTATAPAPAPAELTISFTASFPANAQPAALNLSSALQTDAAAVLQPATVKHGPITLSGVLVSQPASSTSSAIESYSGPATAPALAPSYQGGLIPLATVPNPFPAGIALSNASYKQLSASPRLYAINMQFSNGAAQSDKVNNMLLLAAGADAAAAPTPDQFAIALLQQVPAAVTAIVPYSPLPDLYFVQVSSPPDYTGPVTITYTAAAATTSLSFTIMTQLAVKVTACSFLA